MNTPQISLHFPLWISSFLLSLGIGWAATHQPLYLILIGALTIGLALINSHHSVWLIIFTVGIHFDDLFIPVGFARVGYGDFALFILIGYWFIKRVSSLQSSLRLPEGWTLLILYVIGSGVSWQLGPNPSVITGIYIRNCLYVLGFLLLLDQLDALSKVKLFIWTTLGVIVIHSIIALIIDNPNARVDGLVGQPNIFGALVGPGAIISFLYASDPHRAFTQRIILLITAGLCLIVLLLTVSRGAQVAFLCALLWAYRDRLRILIIPMVIGSLIISLVIINDPERFLYFLQRWALEDKSVSSRQSLIQNALLAISEYPFFGVGFSQFTLLSEVLSIDEGHTKASHNHYLGELASLGIPSALALFSFIYLQGRRLWQVTSYYSKNLSALDQGVDPLIFRVLQSLMIFQSVTLIFRGGRRMIEWSFLALYAAVVLLYHPKYQAPDRTSPE